MVSGKPTRIIKVGGHESDNPDYLMQFATALEKLTGTTVVVHGGGALISELERSVFAREPIFVDGKRKTDSQTLQLAEMVLCGTINKKIVRSLRAHSSLKPIGLSGEDAGLLTATSDSSLGLVAATVSANPKPLIELCQLGYTPVIAPLALSADFQPLNANADTVAAALAKALAVQELVFLTNVPGVIVKGSLVQSLCESEAEELIRENHILGGMIVKVRSALEAARNSKARVRICNLATLALNSGTIIECVSPAAKESAGLGVLDKNINNRGSAIAPLFSKIDVQFRSALGMYLSDESESAFLDFGSGIAVNALGHGHPRIVETIVSSSAKPLHLSNLFKIPEQETLAEKLTSSCFADAVFFSNSGTEANEAALKFALKYHYSRGDQRRTRMIAFAGGFHGRTLGALAVTEKKSYRSPFASHLFSTEFLPFNSTANLEGILQSDVAAVIVEPIQGEAGVRVASPEFLKELRRLCTERGIILIFDEVQCGLMRTGTLWAHQQYDIEPDILTSAKPLGGGLPLGATLIARHISMSLAAGDHGSTFGGNPLACSLALVVLDEVQRMQAHVEAMGESISQSLQELASQYPQWIKAIRGRGLMWGIDVSCTASEFLDRARSHGLIVLSAGPSTIRLLPALICNELHINEFKIKMRAVLEELNVFYREEIIYRTAVAADSLDIFDLLSTFADKRKILPRSFASIERDLGKFIIAQWNGVIVGCVAHRHWTELHWEVRSLVVISGAQKQGIGHKLTTQLIAQANKSGAGAVFALTLCPEFFFQLGFIQHPRSRYDFKEKSDCFTCSFANECQEIAVGIELNTSKKTLEWENLRHEMV